MGSEDLYSKSDHELLILLNERWTATHEQVKDAGRRIQALEDLTGSLKLRLLVFQSILIFLGAPLYTYSVGALITHLIIMPKP